MYHFNYTDENFLIVVENMFNVKKLLNIKEMYERKNNEVKNIDQINDQVKSNELRLLAGNQTRSNKIKIHTVKTSEGIYLQGEGLKYDNLMNYSPKYCKLLDVIFNAVHGKILIYHHYVHGTGILTLQEIFKENGIISENDTPNDYTRCYRCSKIKKGFRYFKI